MSPRMDIIPSNSADRADQVFPTSIPPTHFSSPHRHCYITRNALPAQSDSHSWILIPILSTRFHRFRVPLPWSYQCLVSRFSSRCYEACSQDFVGEDDGDAWRSAHGYTKRSFIQYALTWGRGFLAPLSIFWSKSIFTPISYNGGS